MYLLTLSCPQLFQGILHMQRTQPSADMECYLVQLETKTIEIVLLIGNKGNLMAKIVKYTYNYVNSS